MKDPIDFPPIEDHEAKLELALVDEYLRGQGLTREELPNLPEAQRAAVVGAARAYAAGRLAEIEARAHYVEDLHRHE